MTQIDPPLGNVGDAELQRETHAEQIMSMPAGHRDRWTTEDVGRLIEEREGLTPRYELVEGQLLVTPAPTKRHQRIVLRLAFLLQPYLTKHGLGEVFLGPAELKLAPDERYEPDLFVLPAASGRLRADDGEEETALLVCEVLSPGSSRHDRITKRRSFQASGIPSFWIADGDAEVFEVWRPSDERPAIVDDRLVWAPTGAGAAFELDVASFFASVAEGAELP